MEGGPKPTPAQCRFSKEDDVVIVSIAQADALDFLASLEPASVDLTMFSPPYERARLYLENGEDLGIARNTEEWVEWMRKVMLACLRVTKGLVVCVCEGQTKNFAWSAAPVLLMADLVRWGVTLRKPPIYRRVGIPGSGGPDWFRNDWEFCICATNGGKLPWSDNTAMGHAPKWAPGGEMSYRDTAGTRRNQWGGTNRSSGMRTKSGTRQKPGRPSHVFHQPNGDKEEQQYTPPTLANPGNVIEQTYTAREVADLMGQPTDVIDCNAGGGKMGSRLAHFSEAPFPEQLVLPFVLSFCPLGGIVCDPFTGSGTTASVALANGRNFVGCDLRQSQVDLALKRISGVTPSLFAD